ncbi:MAG: hypothetical protein AAGC56_06910, partial [Pseudomonadota bacterium]
MAAQTTQTHPALPKGVFRWGEAGCAAAASAPSFPFGLGARGVHEVCEASYGDRAAALGFALAAAAQQDEPRRGAVLWVAQRRYVHDAGRLYEAGLGALRGRAGPVLHVAPTRLADVLWTVEEALTSDAVGLVIAEAEDADFTATRRLKLAADRRGGAALLVLPHARQGASAACARWRVAARPSAPNPYDPAALG